MTQKREARPLIILIQPTMGFSGGYVRHIPLSLLYVASAVRDLPVRVKILDHRLLVNSWEKVLTDCLKEDVLFVGFTVMSGAPVKNAIDAGRLVKSLGNVPVVWGGSLPTVAPETVLAEPFVDYVVMGSGIRSARELTQALLNGSPGSEALAKIPGLGFRDETGITLNKRFHGFEPVGFRALPYDLIEDYQEYGEIGCNDRVFPIYSAHGCPYGCTFCISPAMYDGYPVKWVPLQVGETVEHIEFLVRTFQATEIYFYDDDSFVNLDHIRGILRGVKSRGLQVRLGFRGARINEILRMDDAFLGELADSGTPRLHIGLESGSQRILDLFGKGIQVDDILKANRKLAKNPRITAAYNWIVGTPTETIDEIHQTMDVIWRVLRDNPRCFIFHPNKFHPIPGTPMAVLAEKHGYKMPRTLQDWVLEENEGDREPPWYTPEISELIRMLQVTCYFIDNKGDVVLKKADFRTGLLKAGIRLYQPWARFRFKYKLAQWMWEYPVFQWFVHRFRV